MLAGDFYRNLRKLNPRLRIFAGNDDHRPAGLYTVVGDEYIEICGVDKNQLPEKPVFDKQGHIILGGWRRVLLILLQRRMIDRRKTENLFRTRFTHGECIQVPRIGDPILDEMRAAEERYRNKNGMGGYNKHDLMDISSEIRKKNASQ